MKKLALYILFIFGALLIPTIATILISGNMGVADIKMGITVEMKNGERWTENNLSSVWLLPSYPT